MESIASARGGAYRNIPAADDAAAGASDRAIAAEFEAILMRAVFAPVAEAMGFYGDAVVAEAARAIVRVP